jgi:hypothetical protein
VLLGAGAATGTTNSLPKTDSPELSDEPAELSSTACAAIEPTLSMEEKEPASLVAPSSIPENKSKAMKTKYLPTGKTPRKAFFTTLLTTIYVV